MCIIIVYVFGVAPYAGAWIETSSILVSLFMVGVAPYAGAWIETSASIGFLHQFKSLPTRERGLKHGVKELLAMFDQVAPYAGAWIETGCPRAGAD